MSSLFIASRLYRYKVEGTAKLILSVFTIFVSQIILIEIILGIIGKISYENILALTALSVIVTGIFWGKETFKNLSTGVNKSSPSLLILYIMFLPLLILFLIRGFSAMLQIPLEYDVVAYHLPFVVEWINTKSLMNIYYTAFASPIGYYPGNYELLDLWMMIPFKNDFLVNILNFSLMIFLGITLYKILRNINLQKSTSLILSGLLFYMPVFMRQAGTGLTDTFFCLSFALSIYFLQEIHKNKNNPFKKHSNISAYIFFGLNIGLLAGTKYPGILIGIIPILLLLIVLFSKSSEKKLLEKFKLAGMSAASALLTGSFFFIRNWIDSGNPIFPVEVKAFGWKIFDGYLGTNEKLLNTSLIENIKDVEGIKTFIVQYYNLIGLPGILAIISIIGVWGIFIYKLFTKNSKEDLKLSIILLISSLLYLFLYINLPFSYSHIPQNTRYSMPFLIMGIINIGFVYSRIKAINPILDLAILSSIFYTLFLTILNPSASIELTDRIILDANLIKDYPLYFMLSSASFLFLFAAIYLIFTLDSGRKKTLIIVPLMLAMIILRLPVATFAITEREKLIEHTRDTLQKDDKIKSKINAAIYLDKNATNSKIAYSGFNYHYLLFGRNLQRQVSYININECDQCRYVDYKNSEKSIRRDPSYENWMKNLKKENKEYIVLDTEQSKEEDGWAINNKKNFAPVFEESSIKIYKISY